MTVNQAPKPVNWSKDPSWMEIQTALIVSAEATEPNLSLFVSIFKNNAFLTELNAPYDLRTELTDFDLSGLALTEPEAPTDASISTHSNGVVAKMSCELLIKLAEMFGEPAEKPDTFTDFGPYVFVHGHTPYWFGQGLTAKDSILHSYIDRNGEYAVKELRKSQPEYVYIYSHAGTSIPVEYEIIYTDGTNTSADGTAIPMTAKKIKWVNVGWDAVNMDAIADPAKTVNNYIVKFTINGGEEVIVYTLDDHDTDYDQYLLYSNGIGGCEVLRCSGRHSIGMEGSKQVVNMARIRGKSYRDGFRMTYNAVGAESWRMETGYQNQAYIRHLGQLMISDKVWYIDMARQKFESVTIKESEAQLINFENDLYNFGFTMVFDQKPSLSTFGI